MNGRVSKTQVRRVSCGLIPDQTQKTNTIVSSIVGYLFDSIPDLPAQNLVEYTKGGVVCQEKKATDND